MLPIFLGMCGISRCVGFWSLVLKTGEMLPHFCQDISAISRFADFCVKNRGKCCPFFSVICVDPWTRETLVAGTGKHALQFSHVVLSIDILDLLC